MSPPIWTVANHDTYAVLHRPDGTAAARFHVIAEAHEVAARMNAMDAVAAAVQAERAAFSTAWADLKAAIEAAEWSANIRIAESQMAAMDAILARGDTSALTAALAGARREGEEAERERICAILATHVYSSGAEGPYLRETRDARLDQHHKTIIAAIRARSGGKEGGVSNIFATLVAHRTRRMEIACQGANVDLLGALMEARAIIVGAGLYRAGAPELAHIEAALAAAQPRRDEGNGDG